MSVVKFIARKFNAGSSMPTSIRIMRFVSIVGIVISVAALVIATSIGRGFEKEYVRSLLDFNSHLIVVSGDELGDYLTTESLIKKSSDEIIGVTPFIYREAMAIGDGKIRGVVIKGIDPKTLPDVSHMDFSIKDNDTLENALNQKEGDGPSLILGKSLSESMGGADILKLLIPGENRESFLDFDVAGTFESGIYDYDSQFVFIALPEIRKIYDIDAKKVSGFEMRLKDPMKAGEVAELLESKLGPAYQTMTWSELNEELLSAVKLERIVSAIIMGTMVIVSVLNVIAVLVLTIIYRLREISIMRAIGLKRSEIGRIFAGAGLKVSITGTVIGIIVGISILLLVKNLKIIPLEAEIYLIKSLPIDISPLICGMIALFSIAVGYIASALASKKLAAEPIIEGLGGAR